MIQDAVRLSDGSFDFAFEGTTEVDWDSQRTVENAFGEKMYATASGDLVPHSQVFLAKP